LENHARELLDTVSVYYYITELGEMVDKVKEARGMEFARYSFLYPTSKRPVNNKFYHFWSEAFFALHLKNQGFSTFSTRFGLTAVGAIYELGTSLNGISFYKNHGLKTMAAFRATKMFGDMRLHGMGAKFGVKIADEIRKDIKEENGTMPTKGFLKD